MLRKYLMQLINAVVILKKLLNYCRYILKIKKTFGMETRNQEVLNQKLCPLTKSKLNLMSESEIQEFNLKIKSNAVIFVNGVKFEAELKNAYISSILGLIYPIEESNKMVLPKNALIDQTEILTLWKFLFQRFC